MSFLRSAAPLARSAVACAVRASRPLYRPAAAAAVRGFAVKVGETRYTKDHEWVKVTGPAAATVGITDFAQAALGDVVFVDLPEAGAKFEAGDAFGSVESVKAASSVYAPVAFTVESINQPLKDDNSLVNKEAEGAGWMLKVKLTKPEQLEKLMDKAAYAKVVADADKH